MHAVALNSSCSSIQCDFIHWLLLTSRTVKWSVVGKWPCRLYGMVWDEVEKKQVVLVCDWADNGLLNGCLPTCGDAIFVPLAVNQYDKMPIVSVAISLVIKKITLKSAFKNCGSNHEVVKNNGPIALFARKSSPKYIIFTLILEVLKSPQILFRFLPNKRRATYYVFWKSCARMEFFTTKWQSRYFFFLY